jgi:hypothetical protein
MHIKRVRSLDERELVQWRKINQNIKVLCDRSELQSKAEKDQSKLAAMVLVCFEVLVGLI